MKLKYICTLLTLLLALYFVPADSQTKKKARRHPVKHIVKVVKKKPVKKVMSQPVITAKSLGDAIATANQDTSKNGGQVNENGSLSEEIVVTTAYKPVLADAVKIRINPDLDDKAPFKAPLSYSPIDKRLEQNTDIKPLVAMQRPAEKDSDFTNNYLKVGLGNLKTTYGEAYFDNGPDEALQYGGFLKHFAQDGNLYKQNESKDEAAIFGKSIGQINSLSGRIDYTYNTNYFYGFDPSALPPTLNVNQQHFSIIRAEGEFAKNYKDVPNDFTYALKISGYEFSNAYRARESNVVISGFLNEMVNQFYAGVSASLDLTTQNDSLYNYNNSIARVNPYLKFQGETYKIDAGINIVDQFGFNSALNIFPAAKLEFQVIPHYVRLFAEVKGDVNKSTLLNFTSANPFLGGDVPIKNSVDKLDIAAGLKGTLAPGFSFKATIFRNSVKDMPLFISDFNFSKGYNRFTVIYDGGNSLVTGVSGEMDFRASKSLDIFGRVEFNQYQMATVAQPWNMPKEKLTGGATIHISNTVDVTGSLLARSSVLDPYSQPGSTVSTDIKSFIDFNAGISYKASNRISVFVHANNILNTNYQAWLFYPEYGFNIFGGVGFGF